MPVTPEQAIATARDQSKTGPRIDAWLGSDTYTGWCLKAVRTCYGVGSLYQSAAIGWENARLRHRTGDYASIPRGVPVWWTGGSSGFGHVAISDGGGYCWSTDIVRGGYFDRVPIAEIEARWGMPFAGWSEDINGVTVWTAPVPPRRHVPLRVFTANLDFTTGGRADKIHLLHLCKKADVLLLQECKNITVADLLPEGWTCNQDTTADDRRGSVVAWRTDMFKARRRKLNLSARPFHPVTGKRLDMLTRWDNVQPLKVRESGETYRFVANHLAPGRDSVLWPEQLARLGLIRGRLSLAPIVVGTDANQPLEDVAAELRLSAFGVGIVGILLPARRVKVLDGLHVDNFGLREDATDHPAIGVTIQRKKRRARKTS